MEKWGSPLGVVGIPEDGVLSPSTPVGVSPATPKLSGLDVEGWGGLRGDADGEGGVTPPRTGGKLTTSSLRNSFGSMGSTGRRAGGGQGGGEGNMGMTAVGVGRGIVEEVVREAVEEVRMDLGSAVNAMHVDMIRQFSELEGGIENIMEGIRKEFRNVMEENDRLRRENEKLRSIT